MARSDGRRRFAHLDAAEVAGAGGAENGAAPRVVADAVAPAGGLAQRLTLTRRRLLALVAGSAASGLLGDGSWNRATAQESAVRGEVLPLSVGYLEGSDRFADLRARPRRRRGDPELRVVPAADMPLGDQDLALGTVEMRVQGLYPGLPPLARAGFTALLLTVFFPSDDPLHPEPFPFFCWQALIWPGAAKAPPVTFRVPLRVDGGLEMIVEVFDARPSRLGQGAARVLRGGSAPGRLTLDFGPPRLTSLLTDFTVDWYDGRPKLQRGLYFLAVAPRVWSQPWSLPDTDEMRDEPPHERCSLVVSFQGVEEEELP